MGPEVLACGGQRCSFLWREIARYLPTVFAHTRWLIGNGRSIDVAGDPWVDVLPLRHWSTVVSVEAAEGQHVCDLLVPGGDEWDEARLGQLFENHLTERVYSLLIPECADPDIQIWSSSSRVGVRVRDFLACIGSA
ncbi:uncharacterized protein LOC120106779 [Phoenix dactylifera]|uniref:Uncharacterized protein LOC120106779 n=1 Tax=Phoenix dactylifera TaxID=42345 RepID=A0A8B8ZNG7_PHODC|nr:uncharacterized protein LOC120106779 [Phoenix dactylifera]